MSFFLLFIGLGVSFLVEALLRTIDFVRNRSINRSSTTHFLGTVCVGVSKGG